MIVRWFPYSLVKTCSSINKAVISSTTFLSLNNNQSETKTTMSTGSGYLGDFFAGA